MDEMICDISNHNKNNNNNNNSNAGWGLMHTEELYNDEDRSTDEGVLIWIKLKLLLFVYYYYYYDDAWE